MKRTRTRGTLSTTAGTVLAVGTALAIGACGTGGETVRQASPTPIPLQLVAGGDDDSSKERDVIRGGGGRGGQAARDVGTAIYELIEGDSPGELAQSLVNAFAESEEFAGYSVLIIQQETYDGPQDLQDVVYEDRGLSFGVTNNKWDLFVFRSGTFTNVGDLGYENWSWNGYVSSRSDDGRTVTFDSPGQ